MPRSRCAVSVFIQTSAIWVTLKQNTMIPFRHTLCLRKTFVDKLCVKNPCLICLDSSCNKVFFHFFIYYIIFSESFTSQKHVMPTLLKVLCTETLWAFSNPVKVSQGWRILSSQWLAGLQREHLNLPGQIIVVLLYVSRETQGPSQVRWWGLHDKKPRLIVITIMKERWKRDEKVFKNPADDVT